jgi:cell wall-associated NlpC family hydrolase
VFKWLVGTAAIIAVAFPLTLLLFAAAANSSTVAAVGGGGPSALALADIPPAYLAWYMAAAPTCASLPWGVLAGIGKVESDHGRSAAPGVHSGANFAGAEGPMQFLPATFSRFAVDADRGGPLTPYDPADAIYTAAAMLCTDGAATGTNTGIRQAVFAYNHSESYVSHVLAWAARYTVPLPSAAAAIAFALAQVGKPYQWGAAGPAAYDCSGLVFAAYASAGIGIGRTTFQWRQDGPPIPLSQLQPGDLLFSAGTDGTDADPGHVVMFLGGGRVIQAPQTNENVQVDSLNLTGVVVATRPADLPATPDP